MCLSSWRTLSYYLKCWKTRYHNSWFHIEKICFQHWKARDPCSSLVFSVVEVFQTMWKQRQVQREREEFSRRVWWKEWNETTDGERSSTLPISTHLYPILVWASCFNMHFSCTRFLVMDLLITFSPAQTWSSSILLHTSWINDLNFWLEPSMMLPNIILLFPLPSRSSYFKHVAVLVKWGTPYVQTCRQNYKHLWFIVQ